MGIQRVFLGHDRPALVAAAEWLITRHGESSTINLRPVSVVVPGSRAGRRLLEILVQSAQDCGQCLTPPLIETVGKLPEQLYRPKRPFATDLVQRLMWAETLSQASPQTLEQIIPRLPESKEIGSWMRYGDLLRRQHSELAADGLNFGHVAERGAKLDGFVDQARWRALYSLQQDYLRRLDELDLWDIQTARLEAVKRKECSTERDIILIGTVDINVSLRQMLDLVADRVTALVFAPTDWKSRFDSHGCLIPSEWTDIELPIRTEDVEVVDRPADQADAIVRRLSPVSARYRADEIVIGVPDSALIPDIERTLSVAGVTARWGPGQNIAETRPLRLLDAIADYLEHERFSEFAALVRHPDVGLWLAEINAPTDWLEQLDKYQNQFLPFRLPDESLGEGHSSASLSHLGSSIRGLLANLLRPARPIAAWGEPLWELVTTIYGHRPLQAEVDADRVIHSVCQQLRQALQLWGRIPESVMPQVTAAQAIRWLTDEIGKELIPATLTADSIEMLGWLELPLDDSPVVFVTNFNEGFIPQSLNSDLFLPNALRQRLGLLDNSRRYARDAYSVSVTTATHKIVHWIVGRRNHDGDPLTPSRLLFACDEETMVQRSLEFFQRRQEGGVNGTPSDCIVPDRRLPIPHPRPLSKPITGLRVTAFRDYITCPYRFYLRHVERLESISDTLDELDGGSFGSLAHEVLRRFGCGLARDSADAGVIQGSLEQELDRCAAEMFGPEPLPAVLVQIEQLRWRLRSFAVQQAAWFEQGWRIEYIETANETDQGAVFEVDGEPFLLTGRIDRIDVRQATGERVILDYKTSDAGKTPQETHVCRNAWIDLQLPLYRHLVKSFGLSGDVKFGYILLPKDTAATGFVLAQWTPDELAAADDLARQIVRNIRQEVFFPPADPPPEFSDEFSLICQDTVLDR